MASRIAATIGVVVFVILSLPLIISWSNSDNQEGEAAEPVAAREPIEPPPQDLTPFEQIEEGMTYQTCAQLLGGQGQLVQFATAGGAVVHVYSWADAQGFDLDVRFVDGIVVGKERFHPSRTSRRSSSGNFKRR